MTLMLRWIMMMVRRHCDDYKNLWDIGHDVDNDDQWWYQIVWMAVCLSKKNIENGNYIFSAASYFIGVSIYCWQMYQPTTMTWSEELQWRTVWVYRGIGHLACCLSIGKVSNDRRAVFHCFTTNALQWCTLMILMEMLMIQVLHIIYCVSFGQNYNIWAKQQCFRILILNH